MYKKLEIEKIKKIKNSFVGLTKCRTDPAKVALTLKEEREYQEVVTVSDGYKFVVKVHIFFVVQVFLLVMLLRRH